MMTGVGPFEIDEISVPWRICAMICLFFFFSSRRRHTRFKCDWSSDVCSSDLAKANRGKDPLYMFAALQRHLGYPAVPRVRPQFGAEKEIPALQAKLAQLEKRLHLIESELKGNLDRKSVV